MVSGRVCAGKQAKNKQDCAVFKSRLITKYGDNNVVVFGEGSTNATAANYTGGKNNNTMYWSSHGYQEDTNKYKLEGTSTFGAFGAMTGWTSSNTLKVLIVAACNSMHSTALQIRWANQLRSSNVRVFAGYGNTAPAGSDTDVRIARAFFDNLDDGKCVWKAWKAGNQLTSTAKSSWGVISYGDTAANKTYKMPGWGTNSGASRDAGIYLIKQSGNTPINIIKEIPESIPYLISVGDSVVPLSWETVGKGRSTQENGIVCFEYRDEMETHLNNDTFEDHVRAALRDLALNSIVKDARIERAPITISKITETEVKDEQVIGEDMIYQQQYMGVPLHNNFVRICIDAEGIYRIINGWRPIDRICALSSTEKPISFLKAEDALHKAGLSTNEAIIQEHAYSYVDRGDGIYVLCHEITLSNDRVYLLDAKTGECR